MKRFSSDSSMQHTYLVRLLNGNVEMAKNIVDDIINQIPWCLDQVENHLDSDNKEEAILYVLKAKSAFTVLQGQQLANEFVEVEALAKEGNWTIFQNRFGHIKERSISFINELKSAA